jgi:hypothetical protein
MACALVSCVVARAISPPLYPTLAGFQLTRLPPPADDPLKEPGTSGEHA